MYFSMGISDFYNFIEQLKGIREILEEELKYPLIPPKK
jgi:hypothetical protein